MVTTNPSPLLSYLFTLDLPDWVLTSLSGEGGTVPWGSSVFHCPKWAEPRKQRKRRGKWRSKEGYKRRNAGGPGLEGGFQNIPVFTVGLFIHDFIHISLCLCSCCQIHTCRSTYTPTYWNCVAWLQWCMAFARTQSIQSLQYITVLGHFSYSICAC